MGKRLETTYALNDQVTATLRNITRAMSQAVSAMEQMDGQTKQQEKALRQARGSILAAQQAVNSMTTAQRAAVQATENVNRTMRLSRAQIDRMRAATEKAATAPVQLSKAHETLVGSIRRSDQSFSAFGRTVGRGGFTTVARSAKDAERAIDQATGTQNRFNKAVDVGAMNWKGLAAGVLSSLGVFKTVQTAVQGLSGMISKGFDFIEFRQASEAAFKVFLGDAETAETYMNNMYALALKTPFAFPDLLTAGRNMIAFGVEADNTFRVITAIGDAVAGIGGGAAELNSMADVFGQIQSQGKITLMETNRLSQYGINAVQMLADATGKSTAKIQKDISAGLIDSATAFEHIIGGMESQFGGLMEGVKGTLRGTIDSFKSAQRNVGTALLNDMVEPITKAIQVLTQMLNAIPKYIGPVFAVLAPLLDQFNALFDDGRANRFFSTIAVGLWIMATAVSEVGQFAMWVAGIFLDYWALFEPFIIVAAVALSVFVGVLVLYHGWIMLVRAVTAAWAAVQWLVNSALLAFPGTWILIAFIAVIALVIYMMLAWADFTIAAIGIVVGAFTALGAMVINVFIFVANIGILVAETIANVWNGAVYFVQTLFVELGSLFFRVLDGMLNFAISVAEFFTNAWGEAVYFVQLAFHKMKDMILSIMEAVAGGIEGVIGSALENISKLVNTGVAGLNKVISLANKIPGVNIGEIGDVSFKGSSAVSSYIGGMKGGAAPTMPEKKSFGRMNMAGSFDAMFQTPTQKGPVNFGRFDYMSVGGAFKDGQSMGEGWGQSLTGGLANIVDGIGGIVSSLKDGPGSSMTAGEIPEGGDFTGPAADAAGAGKGPAKGKGGKGPAKGKGGKGPKVAGGKLDSVGKIEDDVDISDETIKLLQEWADMKNIQNFVTLQPNIVFDGTVVREEADLDKIYGMIETQLADDIEKSAKGLYT